jgi:hypothetical protein
VEGNNGLFDGQVKYEVFNQDHVSVLAHYLQYVLDYTPQRETHPNLFCACKTFVFIVSLHKLFSLTSYKEM